MDEPLRSIDVDVERAANGQVRRARTRFGPHHVVEVRTDGEKTSFALRYTHHGFEVDASEVSGELERIIDQVRGANPDSAVD